MIANGPLKYVLQVVDYKIRLNSIMVLFFKKVSFIIKGSSSVHVQTPGGGGVLYISLGGEVRQGPSYPDPV